MGLLDDVREGTYRQTPDGPSPWPRSLFVQELAGTARRIRSGTDWWVAVRELLDEYGLRPHDLRPAAVAQEPVACGDARVDAFLGATAEWLAGRDGFERPRWSVEPARFLAVWWVPFDRPSVVAEAIATAPAAFRRRGILLPARALVRV
jgi:hypothetical protein